MTQNHSTELSEALGALDDFIGGRIVVDPNAGFRSAREDWNKALYDKGWELKENTLYTPDGRRVFMGRMGAIKNEVSASIPIGRIEHISRWLFQQSALAVKLGIIKLPVMFMPMRSYASSIDQSWLSSRTFEADYSQIELLSPLSHQFPFLIIGYSNQALLIEPELIEIESDSYVEPSNSIVDRCIEFPPEYHQAGLDILNYFGTYIREQYPEENASVKIEQQGLNVRLLIETESGKSEIVEKALHEYELIVTGVEPPEKFAKSDKLVLELRNELRIAQFRLQSQQDMIGLQNNRIDKLLDLVGVGLSSKNNICVDISPQVSMTNNLQVNHNVISALGSLGELIELVPPSSNFGLALKELEGSLESIEKNQTPIQ